MSPFPHARFLAHARSGQSAMDAPSVSLRPLVQFGRVNSSHTSLHGLAPPTKVRPPQSRAPQTKIYSFTFCPRVKIGALFYSGARLTLVRKALGLRSDVLWSASFASLRHRRRTASRFPP